MRTVKERIKQAVDFATGSGGSGKMIESLPFVGPRAHPRKGDFPQDFWHNVKSTGDLEKDHSLGSTYAFRALQAIKAEHFQPLLGWIVLDMIRNNCPEQIAIGFFQTVADIALGIRQISRDKPAGVRGRS